MKCCSRAFVWGTFSVLCIGLLGCFPTQKLTLKAGHCLSPVEEDCRSDERDSRPILVRTYELRACPELKSLKWSDLATDGKDRELLEDVWLGPPEELILERLEVKELPVYLPPQARCMLLIAIGRREGEHSILIVQPRHLNPRFVIALDRTDLFMENRFGLVP